MSNNNAPLFCAYPTPQDPYGPPMPWEAVERDNGVHALQTVLCALCDGDLVEVLDAEESLEDLSSQVSEVVACLTELADRRDEAERRGVTAVKANARITQAMRLALAVTDLCTEAQAAVRQAKRIKTESEAQHG